MIAEKEKKSKTYREGKLDALTPEKINKIKAFAKEYIGKIIQRAKKQGREKGDLGEPGSSSRPTPEKHGDNDQEMSVEDTLELGEVLEDDDNSGDPSPASDRDAHERAPAAPVAVVGQDIDPDPDIEMSDAQVPRVVPVKIRRPTSVTTSVVKTSSRWEEKSSSAAAGRTGL